MSSFHLPFDPVGQLIENFLAQGQLTATKELAHLSIDEFDGICETALVIYVVAVIMKNNKVKLRTKTWLTNFTYNM